MTDEEKDQIKIALDIRAEGDNDPMMTLHLTLRELRAMAPRLVDSLEWASRVAGDAAKVALGKEAP